MSDIIPYTSVVEQIFFIRGNKVLLDFHLAALYEVETKALKQQVKRNLERFPDDFMFELTQAEWRELVTNCDQLGTMKHSSVSPFAFTEQGVAMLSGILRSPKAVQVNISIMRAFVRMREMLDEHKDFRKKLEELENKYDGQFRVVFEALRQLVEVKSKPRSTIGFKGSVSGDV